MALTPYGTTSWASGQVITASNLNKIENQLYLVTADLIEKDGYIETVKVPAGGEYGQVLTKTGTGATNFQWQNPVGGSVQTVNITETEPTINAQPNFRYICGTVNSITIVPPIDGIFEVVFQSGTTRAVLSATGVTWPSWFDASTLDTNTLYEINIANKRGVVCAWPT